MKTNSLSSLSLAAIVACLAVPASAELKYDNNSGGSVLLYGHLSPAYLSFDDGVSSTSEIVDNTHSNSRVGIWVRQPYGANTFSFNFETGLGFRPSAAVNQISTPDALNWQRIFIRKIDIALQTENAGTFSAGQGSMATDGVAQSDLSGTTLVTYSSIADTAGSFRFRTSAGALSAISVVQANRIFDGGRLGRIRYDSPSFNGFTVSASYGTQILIQNSDFESGDIALRYSGEAGGFRIKGAIGYAEADLGTGAKFHDTMGSLSALHNSGFSVTLAAGNRKETGNYAYGKLGYQANWFGIGKTALAVDYYDGSDIVSVGSSSQTYGFGVVQKFDNANVEAYLGYRTYELAETATSYRDASSVLFGARWKF